ncbi:MAG: metal/formaldehyde-sensitive transcriptional repressor [Steroidobacteraceae bacterium]|nr:metal/formaldehyde-sensitive transcriptional repressor [Steroidobacteraceae bacterium]
MAHAVRNQAHLLTRVRRLKGQVAAIEQALLDEQECADVLQQIAAVRGALNGLMANVIEGHLREHMGSGSDSDTEALLTVIHRYLK